MAGSLIKISETTIAANTALVKVMGIDDTYNVYKYVITNLTADTNSQMRPRFTKASDDSVEEASEYDYALKGLSYFESFFNVTATNNTSLRVAGNPAAAAGSQMSAVFYCFNFSDASEYSYITVESVGIDNSDNLYGYQGGGVLTVQNAHNGIAFRMDNGELEGGVISLYGIRN